MKLFVERGTMRILGGMGSNVYPTVDAGIYAMTNQIVAAVMKVSSGKATVTRLQMNRQGGSLAIFTADTRRRSRGRIAWWM